MKKKCARCLLLLILIPIMSSAKDWRGLRPLHSTCEDVKRVLKVGKCIYPMSEYDLLDFRVTVFFSPDQCCADPNDWRVPPGTVTGFLVSPKREMLPTELGIDMSKYRKVGATDVVGMVSYENLDEGANLDLFGDFVQFVNFFPQASDEKLRCKSKDTR